MNLDFTNFVWLLLCVATQTTAVRSAEKQYGHFWHVTDFHYDHTYKTSQPLSCNANVTSLPALGSYWCDATWDLVTTAVGHMTNARRDVDFVLWTGDTVAHISDKNLSIVINLDIMKNITDVLMAAFNGTPIFSAFGNHDYYPANQFPANVSAGLASALYNQTAEMWRKWIEEEDQILNFKKGGYYTRTLPPFNSPATLRMVVLNTNLYYTSNKQTAGESDPANQMSWLNDTLLQARRQGQKVIVAAHIPPGIHTPRGVQWYQEDFVQPLNTILKGFSDVIVAMHFGHDHHDGFKVFPDSSGQAAIPLFVAPSVTPWRFKLSPENVGPAHNPALRLVTYDRDTGSHVNIDQYYLDMAAVARGATAGFEKLYSFTEHYKVSDLSAASIDNIITRMRNEKAGSAPLRDSYFRFSLSGATDDKGCDESCQRNILCGFKQFTKTEYDQCLKAYSSSVNRASSSTAIMATSVTVCSLFIVLRSH